MVLGQRLLKALLVILAFNHVGDRRLQSTTVSPSPASAALPLHSLCRRALWHLFMTLAVLGHAYRLPRRRIFCRA